MAAPPTGKRARHSPRTLALLAKSGHCAKQFFSVAKRFSPWSPRNTDEQIKVDDFVPFTIPAFELRRLVSDGPVAVLVEQAGQLTRRHGGCRGCA